MGGVDFYRHSLSPDILSGLGEVLQSRFLTTGPVTGEFERQFAAYLQLPEAVGVMSGTGALHLALLALGVGNGDEVITTPLSYVATAHAICYTGATPQFVDVEPDTGNIDSALLSEAITPRTKVIVPVHLYGQMCDMVAIREVADAHGLAVLEDACHAVEARCDGLQPGHTGDAACFSFYATKNLTSGEGGAVATRSSELAERLRRLRNFGVSKAVGERHGQPYEHYDVLELGWKCNMNDLQAALLLGQMEEIETRLRRREEIAQRYEAAFADLPGIGLPAVRPENRSARHLFTIWVEPSIRDDTLWRLQTMGIGVAVNYRPIHLMAYYRTRFGYQPGTFPNAEAIGQRTVTLPLYPGLTDVEVDRVIEAVRKVAC
ncbi:MAG: DegT/DnrJ/EryC1/StrS family aminotransferase [bacterium]|nr:DegT/DnrJ/EryC1/StrS family aminotransferase [bacterium]